MFKKDLTNEAIISKWVKNHFFNTDTYNGDFEYITDLDSQKKGVDLILQSNDFFGDNNPHMIDEKSASNYIRIGENEKNMPTFAFELDYQGRDGSRNDGWLFGEQFATTEYYLLSWLWAGNYEKKLGKKRDVPVKEISYEILTKAKCLLIKKKRIQEYLTEFKVTNRNYRKISQRIRDKSIVDEDKKSLTDSAKYPSVHYSPHLIEKPVNVVIHQDALERLATKRIFIYKNSVSIS